MKKTIKLVKVYALGNFGINKMLHRKGRASSGKIIAAGVSILLIALLFLAISSLYNYVIGEVYNALGMPQMLLAMMMAVASLLCLVTTIYKGSAILFQSNDYNLIMPMPIAHRQIVTAKLITLYGMNLMFTLLLMLPAIVVYAYFTSPSAFYYPLAAICTLLLPVIPLLIGTFLSVLVSLVSSRFKSKNLIAIVLMLLFCVGVMMFSFSLNSMDGEQFIELARTIEQMLNKIYPLAGMFVSAVAEYHLLSFVAFIGLSVVLFLLFAKVVGWKFQALYSLLTAGRTGKRYKIREISHSSQNMALYKRELKHYFSSPGYVVNTIFALVMLTILSVFLLTQRSMVNMLLLAMPQIGKMLPAFAAIVIAMLAGMGNTTAVSISLEGKNFPLLKSFPVTPMQVMTAKMGMSLTFAVPAVLLNAVLLSIALDFDIPELVLCMSLPLCYVVFSVLFGMLVNLCLPKFDWTNETAVVKQSAASMVGVFGGMLLALIPLPFVFLFSNSVIVLVASSLFYLVVDILLWRALKGWGTRKYYALS